MLGLNGFYPNCCAVVLSFRSSDYAWRVRAVGAVVCTRQDGKPMENCQGRSASNRAMSFKSLVCIASASWLVPVGKLCSIPEDKVSANSECCF